MSALERIKLITSLVQRLASLQTTAPEAFKAFEAAVKEAITDAKAARADGDLTADEILTLVADAGQALHDGAMLAKAAIAK